MKCRLIVIGVSLIGIGLPRGEAQNLTRAKFTPPVVPENFAQSVRFEATYSSVPTGVTFTYNGSPRTMYDDGSNGDVIPGDNVWTLLFTANEILSKNIASRVFRPFIGTCQRAGGGSFNVVAECWTSAIGLPPVRAIDATGQETDYITNYVGTAAQITSFSASV